MTHTPPSSDGENYDTMGEDVRPETNYPLNEEVEVPHTNGQLFKTLLQEGNGSYPPDGAEVTVHYTGTLADNGKKFDSSRDRGEYFKFTIGKGQVIKGWDKGVATMRKGERANLKCAPEYAYGAHGSPPTIPGNSTLNFDVELFDWTKSEDVSVKKDRSILKSTLVSGTGFEKPSYETECVIDAAVIDRDYEEDMDAVKVQGEAKVDWKITIGDTELPTGFQTLLESMLQGESCYAAIRNVTVGCPELPELKADGSRQFVKVEMKSFKTVKTYEWSGKERVEQATNRKAQGNEFFKTGKWDSAIAKYKRGLEFVEHDYDLEGAAKEDAAKVKIATWGNLSQCLLNTGRSTEAISYCDKVLAEDPKNEKALFRRGKAKGAAQEWDDGIKDLTRLVEINPGNGDAINVLNDLKAQRKAFNDKEKAKFSKMFA